MRKLSLEIVPQGSLNRVAVEPILQDSIIMAQLHDKGVKIIKQQLAQGEEKYKCFQKDPKGILRFKGCMVVPKNHQLHKQIMDEAHLSKFAILTRIGLLLTRAGIGRVEVAKHHILLTCNLVNKAT
jgi:hypothetical protein